MDRFSLESDGFTSLVTVYAPDERPWVMPVTEDSETLLITDENTQSFVEDLRAASGEALKTPQLLSLAAGESGKNLRSLEEVLEAALEGGLSRTALFVVMGGGVLCDLGAFAASVYLRGVRVQLIPTTLLAMVDAAVGGKTGVNFAGYKNMVGTFYPAEEVRIFPSLLRTLPEEEYRSGLAEVIKAALLGDPELLELLESEAEGILAREPSLLRSVISRAVAVKIDVVREDLREGGRRAILNFGHTYAHALESVAGFGAYSHGEAVAWGMARALELGRLLGITDTRYRERVISLLARYGYNTGSVSEAPAALLDAMGHDKKRQGSSLRFILQRGLCETEVLTVDRESVEKSLAAGL